MGGSESTLVRIADSLEAHASYSTTGRRLGRYPSPRRMPAIKHVVINRDSRAIHIVRSLYPHARIFLWLHDRVEPGRGARAGWTRRPTSCSRPRTHRLRVGFQRRGVEATLRLDRSP